MAKKIKGSGGTVVRRGSSRPARALIITVGGGAFLYYDAEYLHLVRHALGHASLPLEWAIFLALVAWVIYTFLTVRRWIRR